MNAKASHYKRLSLVLDNVGVTFAWLLSIHLGILFGEIHSSEFFSYASILALLIPIQIWAFHLNSEYSINLKSQAIYLTRSLGLVVMGLIAVAFVTNLIDMNRWIVFTYAALGIVGLIAAKYFVYFWYFHGYKEKKENYTKVLIVGTGPRARAVAKNLQLVGDWGTEVIGYVDPQKSLVDAADSEVNGDLAQIRINHVEDIQAILSDRVVDEVVIALPRNMLSEVQALVQICGEEGICIKLVADIFDVEAATINLSHLEGLPILEFHPVAQNMNMLIVKRIFDLVATIIAIPFLVPLFALVALIVKLDSPGPVFFTQLRVGINKRQFRMFKFRSMFEDAEARMSEIEHLNEADGPNFKIANDPRVTRVGGFLRKTSIDELPQLINVFLGHMSLVGPRPMSLRDVNMFDKSAQRRRFSVRPGCTCTWQISGRSSLTFEEWLALDLAYIDNWSFFDDLRILLKTVPASFAVRVQCDY